ISHLAIFYSYAPPDLVLNFSTRITTHYQHYQDTNRKPAKTLQYGSFLKTSAINERCDTQAKESPGITGSYPVLSLCLTLRTLRPSVWRGRTHLQALLASTPVDCFEELANIFAIAI
ncbi:MAG: hypothetical protein P8163_07750, partial [Candidatus Thiodiazotropha sp.]